MKKELIISVIVILFIIMMNFIENNKTRTSFEELTSRLDVLRSEIIDKKEDKDLKGEAEGIIADWKKKNEVLSFYIEHNELEKLQMYLWEISSNVETKEYNMAVQGIDTCRYLISHIKEKYELSLKNVF